MIKNFPFILGIGFFSVTSIFIRRDQAYETGKHIASPPAVPVDCSGKTGLAKVVCLAGAFKATLKDDQLALLQLAYSKKDAVRWSNFPQAFSRPDRVGLGLGSLSAVQRTAMKALMASVLARGVVNEGSDELEGILAADDYFGKTTGKTNTFGSANFYIAFLGQPSTTALWELQFGGHHFAFANTYLAGKITGVTPSFRGVEPMAPTKTPDRSYQPVEQERMAFFQLIGMLSDAEKKSARLPGTFSDLLLGPNEDGNFPNNRQGIRISDLNSARKEKVIKAIELYVNDLDPGTAQYFMSRYTAELAATYISFAGSGTMDQANDYIRLDGPSLWIEYSVQPSRDFPNTTHPHSVWRDRKSDYGGN